MLNVGPRWSHVSIFVVSSYGGKFVTTSFALHKTCIFWHVRTNLNPGSVGPLVALLGLFWRPPPGAIFDISSWPHSHTDNYFRFSTSTISKSKILRKVIPFLFRCDKAPL